MALDSRLRDSGVSSTAPLRNAMADALSSVPANTAPAVNATPSIQRLHNDADFKALYDFSIGRMQLPYVAAAALAGGNVRVGLEDNIYLDRGVLASNGDLVERATTILSAMNVNILGPEQVREKLKLRKG